VDTSTLTILKAGGPTMWLIGACSVAAVAVAVERAIALFGFTSNARSLADAVARALLRGDLDDARARCESSSSPAADVFLAALAAAARRGPARANGAAEPDLARITAAVERERQQVNLRLRRSLWLLGTIGATAPFIGLFGTVWGIMHAFRQMGITGQGGFAVVATGISEALITTAAGIAVAILAVILYNLLNVHVQKLALQLRLLVEEYLEVVAETLPAIRPAPPQTGEALRKG
jgi:biopolymer transport protein ExbB